MNTQEQTHDARALDDELDRLAPDIRAAFDQIGGPSEPVLRAIRDEARRHAFRHRAPKWRAWAAAAALALLAAGALHLHLAGRDGRHARTVGLLLQIGAPHGSARPASDGTREIATRLLDIQGLDEEAFFSPEEAQPLWL